MRRDSQVWGSGPGRFFRFGLTVLLAGLVAGCITETQFRPFRSKIYQLEKASEKTEERFLKLDRETKKALMAMREDQANIKADMLEIRTEIQQVRGEVSSDQHTEELAQREGKALEEAVILQLGNLQQQAQTMEERLERMEKLLAMKSKAPVAKAPRKPPPASLSPPASGQAKVPPEEVYDKAYTTYKAGDYENARQAFEQFVQNYPDSKYVDNAIFWTGETYYRLGEYEQAVLKYQEVLEKYPAESKAPDALLKMGFALEMMGENQAAIAALERLLRDYPKATQAEPATRKVTQLKQKKTEPKEDRGNEVKQGTTQTDTEEKPPEKSTP